MDSARAALCNMVQKRCTVPVRRRRTGTWSSTISLEDKCRDLSNAVAGQFVGPDVFLNSTDLMKA